MSEKLEESLDIAAAPEQVWQVLTDLRRMGEFSPQCVRMIPLGKPRPGTWTINLNKEGWKYWPSTSRILHFDENRTFAFRMNENRSIWRFELTPIPTGTRITESREVAATGIPWPIRKAIDLAIGGEQVFDEILRRGMRTTLETVKATVET